jgi:hypothetical protein
MDQEAILRFDLNTITGDSIEFQANREGDFDIEIDEPWAGDSETGFGSTARVSLNRTQALALRDWLAFHLQEAAKNEAIDAAVSARDAEWRQWVMRLEAAFNEGEPSMLFLTGYPPPDRNQP